MCAGLTWTGVAFEVVGLGLVAVELTRVQRRDLGTPRWLQRVQNAARRLTGRPAVRRVVGLDSAVEVDSAVGLGIWRGASVPDVEHRLAALEANWRPCVMRPTNATPTWSSA